MMHPNSLKAKLLGVNKQIVDPKPGVTLQANSLRIVHAYIEHICNQLLYSPGDESPASCDDQIWF